MPTREISGASFVIVGTFNPAIFHPAWLAAQELIPPSEATDAKNIIVTSDLSVIQLPWVRMQVTTDRFIATTTHDSHFNTLRDLVSGAFEVLRHTPIRQLGINVEQHYKFESEETWNAFGHRLAPKKIWKQMFRDPGMRAMTIVEKAGRTDGLPGLYRVDVEASVKVKLGVYFRVNDHYELQPKSGEPVGTSELLPLISKNNFGESLKRAQGMIDLLINYDGN
ncbi:MAG TPA: hypothetical protein VNT99_12965 [Methylomirabilota bacterium]|nr:hypothetical protein [Methylomirabilota bacterium]